jgi:hypothetical protein
LQRLFSSFPSGPPGFALLLLRVLMSLTLMVEALKYLRTPTLDLSGWIITALMMASALAFLAGLMTPFLSAIVVIGVFAHVFSLFPSPNDSLFKNQLAIMNVIVVGAALGALGPGAFSLDARMFGRREIKITSHGNHADVSWQ